MFTVALLRYFYVCDATIVFRKERWLHFLKKVFFLHQFAFSYLIAPIINFLAGT